MFWNILIIIDLVIAFLFCLFSYLVSYEASKFIRRIYPEIKPKFKSTAGESVATWLRIIFMSLIPIVNLIYLFVLIFGWDTVKDKTIQYYLEKYSRGEV
jgi:hypothetical protein